MSAPPASKPQLIRGIVKQVLSGDSIVIRGQPKGGPPPEKTVNFAGVSAPRLGRRPGGKGEDANDEPYAWESREFLRKKLIGKDVFFQTEYTVPRTPLPREFGTVYLGKDVESGENITDLMISEGLLTVRKDSKSDNQRLLDLENAAKVARKGKWAEDGESHVRDVIWQVDNARALLDKMGRKPIPAVVEHVRDGSTVRVFLLPTFHYVTVMMSGIRAPGKKLDNEGKPTEESEPFTAEALFFTESRLLHRDVEVILEADSNQNFIGSVIHPNGNIAELLLKEGFAKCVDWSMGFVTGGAEKLRAAETYAREKKLRRWKDYQAGTGTGAALMKGKDKEFVGTVVEVVNGDALVVKLADGTSKKIFIASVRPPRLDDEQGKADAPKPPKVEAQKGEKKAPFRPLYDVPYMLEAREFLRKRLIGKKVNVTLDYIQPASQQQDTARQLAEKLCCTVKHEGANIGEALLVRGLAKVVRYRQDDDQRASEYDTLLTAEAKAKKEQKGLHSTKKEPVQLIVDLSGDAAKAKQFLPFYQRAGRTTGIVEFVSSGSRVRLFNPRENRLITFLLGGISCPRAPRLAGGPGSEGEPYGEAAMLFTKDLCLQREVEIEVDSIDKNGSFIGFMFVNGKNLSEALVEEGLATVHFSADRTPYNRALQTAEAGAKARRIKIWQDYEESKDEAKPEDDKPDRKVDQKTVVVTEVTPELHIYVQFADDGDKLETLMTELRKELSDNPPVAGNYNPKRGDICVAKYSADNEWYRAKIEKALPNGEVAVLFIDYGNRETVKAAQCAQLPGMSGASAPAYAKEYALACINLPTDEEYSQDAINALRTDTAEGRFLVNVEYKVGNLDYVTLVDETSKEDIGERLIKEGLFLVENRKERRLQKLVRDYKAAETEAKKQHNNIWRYGDITEDDAREFGVGVSR